MGQERLGVWYHLYASVLNLRNANTYVCVYAARDSVLCRSEVRSESVDARERGFRCELAPIR